MNWLDGLIIVFLGICAFIGSRMGLIRTFFPLAIIVLAIFVAGHYYPSAADYSNSWMSSRNQAKIVAFIIIFILVIVAAMVFFFLFRKLMDLLLKGKAEMTNSVIPLHRNPDRYSPGWILLWLCCGLAIHLAPEPQPSRHGCLRYHIYPGRSRHDQTAAFVGIHGGKASLCLIGEPVQWRGRDNPGFGNRRGALRCPSHHSRQLLLCKRRNNCAELQPFCISPE